MGTPCIVGKSGVDRIIELELNDEERRGLHASAEVLKKTLADLRNGTTERPQAAKQMAT